MTALAKFSQIISILPLPGLFVRFIGVIECASLVGAYSLYLVVWRPVIRSI